MCTTITGIPSVATLALEPCASDPLVHIHHCNFNDGWTVVNVLRKNVRLATDLDILKYEMEMYV